MTDYHCHILPEIDDGSESVEMSLKMIEMLKKQGVERIIATPHFYAHREKSVSHFIEKRQQAYEKLMAANPEIKDIILGAEVAVEKELSEIRDIENLAIQNTDMILLELPYKKFSGWLIEEIENISATHRFTPIIAHISRYVQYYSKADYEKVLQMNAIFQVNAEAVKSFKERQFVKHLIKNEIRLVFGSDSHNMDSRKPDFDLITKKFRKNNEIITKSDSILEKRLKK